MVTTKDQERLSSTIPPSAPVDEPPERTVESREDTGTGPRWWLIILLIVILVPLLAFAGWLIVRDDGETVTAPDVQPEWLVDSAFIAPLAPGTPVYVGSDVNLDPDYAFVQSEYDVDTILLVPLTVPAAFHGFLGEDAAFDVDYRWIQSEYELDTAMIPVVVNLSGPGWIGGDAGLD